MPLRALRRIELALRMHRMVLQCTLAVALEFDRVVRDTLAHYYDAWKQFPVDVRVRAVQALQLLRLVDHPELLDADPVSPLNILVKMSRHLESARRSDHRLAELRHRLVEVRALTRWFSAQHGRPLVRARQPIRVRRWFDATWN